MDNAWHKGEETKNFRPRVIPRNCGQLLGDLKDLLPCLYFAKCGVSASDKRMHNSEKTPGLFTIGARFQDDRSERPSAIPHLGLILPLYLCRDEKARAALQEIANLIGDQPRNTMSDKRRVVQANLGEAFSGDLMLSDLERFDGFIELKPGPGLFRRLHESFDYVTDVLDNTADFVKITGATHFPWKTYGELMEWFHTRPDSGPNWMWSPLKPYFVAGNTAVMNWLNTERWAEVGLQRPAEEPSKWFMIRPDLPNARINLRLEMGKHGWAMLHISLDDVTVMIQLSEVFDPFGDMLAWGREIAEGDLPVKMEIDEEGEVALLTALRTEDPERLLLRVTHRYSDGISLEGIVSRADLASALKNELHRFFTTDFDPQHWDSYKTDDIQVKDLVLNHTWLVEQA